MSQSGQQQKEYSLNSYFQSQQKQQYFMQQQQYQSQWSVGRVPNEGGVARNDVLITSPATPFLMPPSVQESSVGAYTPFPIQCHPNNLEQVFTTSFSNEQQNIPLSSPTYHYHPHHDHPNQQLHFLRCCSQHLPQKEQLQQQQQQQQQQTWPFDSSQQQSKQVFYQPVISNPANIEATKFEVVAIQGMASKQLQQQQQQQQQVGSFFGQRHLQNQIGVKVYENQYQQYGGGGGGQGQGGVNLHQPKYLYIPYSRAPYQQSKGDAKQNHGQQVVQVPLFTSQQQLQKHPDVGMWGGCDDGVRQVGCGSRGEGVKGGYRVGTEARGPGSSGQEWYGYQRTANTGVRRSTTAPLPTRDALSSCNRRSQRDRGSTYINAEFQKWRETQRRFRHSLHNHNREREQPFKRFIHFDWEDDQSVDDEEEDVASLLENARRLGIPESLVLSDRDFESADYEALLMLEKGNISKGATPQEISKLPATNIKDEGSMQGERCTICLEGYCTGDTIRTLPCQHVYHIQCIDKWSAQKPLCPICGMDWKEHMQKST